MAEVRPGAPELADLAIAPTHSMGVTALLDELLATGCGREPPPSSPVYDPMEPISCPERLDLGLAAEVVTPRSRQISELCGEMDTCLASLGKWEEESRLRVEALRKDLQAKYGFAFDARSVRSLAGPAAQGGGLEAEAAGLNGTYRRLLDGEGLVNEAYGRALAAGSGPWCGPAPAAAPPGSPGSLMATSPLRGGSPGGGLAAGCGGSIAAAAAAAADPSCVEDEARITALRAEVEVLRQREQDVQQDIMQQWMELEASEDVIGAAPSSAAGAPSPDSVGACFNGSASELSALCREADSWLREASGSPAEGSPQGSGGTGGIGGGGAACPPEPFAAIEARLVNAQGGLKHMEVALGSARSTVDSELSELERLLASEDRAAAGGS